jgi:glycosyltransferase involved in cell wall biosynthesis
MESHSGRPTLGIYGPKLPERSGVANYIQSLMQHVDSYQAVHVSNTDWEDPRAFDHVLYHVGASRLHHGVFKAMRIRPGPAIVHEHNILSYFYEAWEALEAHERGEFLEFIGHGAGRVFTRLDEIWNWLDAIPDCDRYCAEVGVERLFLSNTSVAFVHSSCLASRLRKSAPTIAVHTIPLMSPRLDVAHGQAMRRELGLSPDDFVFGVFGFIGQYKRVESILEAWARWTDRPVRARLLIVGQPQYELGIPALPGLMTHGYVESHDRFNAMLAATDCAIQLRYPSLGETSGIASTCLANRLPLITSKTAFTEELTGHAQVSCVEPGPNEVGQLLDAMAAVSSTASRPRLEYDPSYEPQRCARRIIELALLPSCSAGRE